MASPISVIYHRWAARYHSNVATVEKEMTALLTGEVPNVSEVETSVRDAIRSYVDLGDELSERELRTMAPLGLKFADLVTEFSDALHLPSDHTLRELQDELADHAETIAESVDPGLLAAHDEAMRELQREEVVPFESVSR